MSVAAGFAAGLTLTFSTVALADNTDAKVTQLQSNSYMTMPQMAQTFTALHTGQLYQVDLYAGIYLALPTTLEIWTVSGGAPSSIYQFADGTAAATALPVPMGSPMWRHFPLSKAVPVVAGTQYAVVTHLNLGYYFRWAYTNSSNANFPGGKMYVRSYSTTSWSQVLTAGSAFNFVTYVNTAVSQPKPPVIAADKPSSSADEGTAPTMTGTYSDPNGGTVTLTADHGKVTPQSGSRGAWSWSGDTWDEGAAPASITITATNAAGSTPVTFPLTINPVRPVATITTDPVSLPEGSSLNLLGSATTANSVDQSAGFSYAWDVTKDGSPYSAGSGSPFNFTVGDEGLYDIKLTATDDGGNTSYPPASMQVVGAEVTPVAKIDSITPVDTTLSIIAPSEMLNFAGSFTDPAQESHTFTWDFGDGTSSTTLAAPHSYTASAPHSYTAAGTYTVTLAVADDEKVTGIATTRVTVQTPQQALSSMTAYIQGLSSLNKGQQNSLMAKLQAASDAYSRGDNRAAHNQLNAFITELEADLKTGKISSAAYNTLRADAHAIQGALGTYNRFVEWWPLAA